MPRRPRTGDYSVLYAELPPDIVDWLWGVAMRNVRSTTAELQVVLDAARAADPHAKENTAAGKAERRKRKKERGKKA
jgi:hypothetical protein